MGIRRPSHESLPVVGAQPIRRVLVWDVAVRVFHWGLVAAVAVAWLTGGSGDRLHELAGSTAAALVLFRLIWGFAGTRHARFTDFVRGPVATLNYLGLMARGRAPRHIGHNPAGGAMILILLALLTVAAATGAMQVTNAFYGVAWVDTTHRVAANGLLMLVPLHVLGAIASSLMHRENLIASMISGMKRVSQDVREQSRSNQKDHDQLLMRIRASQGFSLLLLLVAGGVAAGWVVTSGRTTTNLTDQPSVRPVPTSEAQNAQRQDPLPVSNPAGGKDTIAADSPAASPPITQQSGPCLHSQDSPSTRNCTVQSAGHADREVRLRGRLTGYWSVDGLPFRIEAAARIDKSSMVGDYVEVRGFMFDDGMLRATRVKRR
jgi:cytochrome b